MLQAPSLSAFYAVASFVLFAMAPLLYHSSCIWVCSDLVLAAPLAKHCASKATLYNMFISSKNTPGLHGICRLTPPYSKIICALQNLFALVESLPPEGYISSFSMNTYVVSVSLKR